MKYKLRVNIKCTDQNGSKYNIKNSMEIEAASLKEADDLLSNWCDEQVNAIDKNLNVIGHVAA